MFRTYFDEMTFYPWQFILIVGASLVVSAILIFLLPELLAYFVATVLLWIGVLFLGLALQIKKLAAHKGW
ncbi:MAG: hypothetical protein ACE5G1_06150 [bacterium]